MRDDNADVDPNEYSDIISNDYRHYKRDHNVNNIKSNHHRVDDAVQYGDVHGDNVSFNDSVNEPNHKPNDYGQQHSVDNTVNDAFYDGY